jgi:uncharacterized membrane protein
MNPETIQWMHALHVFGIVFWIGGMAACLQMLIHHGKATEAAREVLSGLERKTAMLMDMGALLAIGAGLALAFGQPYSPFKGGGWLHAKLTVVVVVVLGLHGFVRVQIRKFRDGQVKELPGFLLPVLIAVAFGVIVLPLVRPF